jgi:hypothetical protein
MAMIYGANNNIAATVVTSNVSNIVTDQLRLYYDTGRSYSYPGYGPSLYDLSGYNNTATMYNAGSSTYTTVAAGAPTFTSARLGEFVFDGVNDWGKFTEFNSTNAFSVSVWFKTTSINDMGFLSHCNGGPVGESFGLNAGKMYYLYYTTSWQSATGTSSVNDGNWKNIVFTKNGTALVMYINGVQDYSTTMTGSKTSLLNCIGSKWGPCYSDSYGVGTDSYGSVFNGTLAILMAHTKQLSAAEVLQNYNNLKRRFGL